MKPLIIFLLNFISYEILFSQQNLEICGGGSQTFTYHSESNPDGNNVWYVNGVHYESEDLTYTFTQGGIYNIVLRRENGLCYVEETFSVTVTECQDIVYYIPNTFTPDSDEHNQLFGPIISEGVSVSGFSFLIFNRWGQLIWETRDPSGKWDGTYGGKKCQDGVYSWKIQFNLMNSDGKVENSGTIVLIK
jgi:gliding motility-associated-like protein